MLKKFFKVMLMVATVVLSFLGLRFLARAMSPVAVQAPLGTKDSSGAHAAATTSDKLKDDVKFDLARNVGKTATTTPSTKGNFAMSPEELRKQSLGSASSKSGSVTSPSAILREEQRSLDPTPGSGRRGS